MESFLSVEDNFIVKCASVSPRPSLEDISADLVKDTLGKVMSGMVDSPSSLNINPGQTDSGTEKMIDSPSIANLDQLVNHCYQYQSLSNSNVQSVADEMKNRTNHESKESSAISDKADEVLTIEDLKNNHYKPDPLEILNSDLGSENLNKLAETYDCNAQMETRDNSEMISESQNYNPAFANNPHVTVGNCEARAPDMTAQELYSSSSTHLCSRLSETLQINHSHINTQQSQGISSAIRYFRFFVQVLFNLNFITEIRLILLNQQAGIFLTIPVSYYTVNLCSFYLQFVIHFFLFIFCP